MFEQLKTAVYEQNLRLPNLGLVILTEGNVSQISADRKYVAIKPSGVEYTALGVDKIAVVDMQGNVVDGALRPSTDTPTHLELYRRFPNVGGIAHTHSPFATAFAQIRRPIPCYGTTHADAFYEEVPVTRELTEREIESEYELNTGKVIGETLTRRFSNAVLVAWHGPFVFGVSACEAVEYASILEKVARIALIATPQNRLPEALLRKHYERKHGAKNYYGQD